MRGVVTFLTDLLTNALSLQDVEGAATQVLFVKLDGEVDASVYALETAPNAAAFTAAQQQYSDVFSTFGDDGLKLGAEIGREANVFGIADLMLSGHERNGGAMHADFRAFDKQLVATANDFSGLGVDLQSLGTIASQDDLLGVVTNLAGDSASLAADFGALSAQSAALQQDLAGSHATEGLAAAMAPLSGDYAAIATDFNNMFALYGGATESGTGAPMTFGSMFKSLDADLITLDNSMHGVAAPMANAMMGAMFGGGRC